MKNYKIDVMIIGAHKAGTTSLSKLLSKHPNVCSHYQHGEYPYFVNDDYYNKGIQFNWKEYFEDCNKNLKEIILAKNVGVMYSEKSLKRLYEHNPNVKLILLLRNPVERAYSAYWFAKRKGWENKSMFKDAINAGTERFGNNWIARGNCDYLIRGEYANHIKILLKYFNKNNILIYRFEDFKKDEMALCKSIWKELGLTTDLDIEFERRVYNKSAMPKYIILNNVFRYLKAPIWIKNINIFKYIKIIKRNILKKNEIEIEVPTINKDDRELLLNYYKLHNKELEKIIGWNVESWNN